MLSEEEETKTSAITTEQKKNDDDDIPHDMKLSNLYNLERPKDVMSGVADVSSLCNIYFDDVISFTIQGAGNMLRGVLGGAALMVSAPVKGAYDGAKSGGAWGAIKGFGMGAGAGIVGGAAVAVGGVATGVYQVNEIYLHAIVLWVTY